MKRLTHVLAGILVATVTLAFATTAVMARDKAKAEKAKTAPAKETKAQGDNVLFENERVRMTESRRKAGDKTEMKARKDRVAVCLNPAKLRDGDKIEGGAG